MSRLTLFRLPLLLSLTLITGCGYSLRGDSSLQSDVEVMALNLQQPNGEFARLLRRSLERADVEVIETDAVAANQFLLSIANERISSRPVSVNPRARAAQYEIRISVDLLLQRGDEVLIERETLLVERTYLEDIENIAGTQEEVEILTAEMRRELVNQLIRRLESATGPS